MPCAPPSSARVAIQYWLSGTRTIGAMPVSSAATDISQAVSIDMELCSRSRNSQSKPAVSMILAVSTLRAWRSTMPSESSF